MRPMQEGQYVAISPGGGICCMRVEPADPQAEQLSLPPEMLEVSGLSAEMLAKFNRPVWRVILEMEAPGENVPETVVFAMRVAQRLAALGDGVVMDTRAYRFFAPEGWPVEEPNPEFDVREHVHIHLESDSGWLHTHGLIKFGRPEMEIYEVTGTAGRRIWNIAGYCAVCGHFRSNRPGTDLRRPHPAILRARRHEEPGRALE